MKPHIHNQVSELLNLALKETNLTLASGEPPFVDATQDSRFGDLTTNVAMQLARQEKKSPAQIAQVLITSLQQLFEISPLKPYMSTIKMEGAGFINFYLSEQYFHEHLKELLTQGKDALRANKGKGEKVLVEFVSANPTGPLSVAHARQAAVGDALANVMRCMGYAVSREYYLNDEGNQINILGNSVRLRAKELAGEKQEFPENFYQGDYIYDIAREATKNNIPQEKLNDYAADYILAIIKRELGDFKVVFDNWYSQKTLGTSGKIEAALKLLRERGYVYDSEGATWLKSTEFGDDKDRVVIKSDGSYTYLAPDIAYHKDKFDRGFSKLINLWGPDHHGYIPRLKASVDALGFSSKNLEIVIVQLATIFRGGKELNMSTRKGQYITLQEVLDDVGVDASRFFFLMRRTSSHLDFDLDVAKKQSAENPVYYVQYAHARIASILRSSQVKFSPDEVNFTLLKEKEELALAKKIWRFYFTLQICLSTLDPYMITVYLQELAETFHKFYDLHRVLGEDKELTITRLALIQSAKTVLAAGLELLHVSQPESM